MLTVFASADITVQAVEGAAAVWVYGIVVQKPRISSFGFVQY